MGLQLLIVFVGGTAFHCVNGGLHGKQLGICFGFSAITLVVSLVMKLIPCEKIIDPLLEPKPATEEEEKNEGENKVNEDKNKDKVVEIEVKKSDDGLISNEERNLKDEIEGNLLKINAKKDE